MYYRRRKQQGQIDRFWMLITFMAAQPDVQVINNAIAQLAGEITKFPNIPAIANGNAILDAINGLENRLIARMRAS